MSIVATPMVDAAPPNLVEQPTMHTDPATGHTLAFPADTAQVTRKPGKGIQEQPQPLEMAANAMKVAAVVSHPRLGFMDHVCSLYGALVPLRISLHFGSGAYWGQCMERVMMKAIEEQKPDAILTLDYDTMFTMKDVGRLVHLMANNPSVDAIAALQSHRHEALPLMTILDKDRKPMKSIGMDYFMSDLSRISTAHFGLTLLRVKSLLETPHPWFKAEPNSKGLWEEGRMDDDIFFWFNWEKAGKNLYLANRVVIGHLELMVRWPGRDFRVMYQHPNDYRKDGPPIEAWQ